MSCFSLRGIVEFADNSIQVPIRIFDYVSPDRTRAWKVTRALWWPVEVRASIGAGTDAKMLCQASLATDHIKGQDWNNINDPSENRSFGWAMWAGYTRENGGSDYITPEVDAFAEFLIDPDTIVVKELWISAANTAEQATNPTRTWGYMIELEEIKVSPSQSVYQQIKGGGQDL